MCVCACGEQETYLHVGGKREKESHAEVANSPARRRGEEMQRFGPDCTSISLPLHRSVYRRWRVGEAAPYAWRVPRGDGLCCGFIALKCNLNTKMCCTQISAVWMKVLSFHNGDKSRKQSNNISITKYVRTSGKLYLDMTLLVLRGTLTFRHLANGNSSLKRGWAKSFGMKPFLFLPRI